jgi:hypothetical protein
MCTRAGSSDETGHLCLDLGGSSSGYGADDDFDAIVKEHMHKSASLLAAKPDNRSTTQQPRPRRTPRIACA